MPKSKYTFIAQGAGVRIVTVNAKLVRQGLENLVAVDFPQIGRQRLYKVAQKIYRLLGIYPNQDVGSKYVRTDQLRNSRKLEKLDNGYQVRNDPVDPRGVHYGTYVRGDAHGIGQTAYHKKRWYSLDNIINFSMKDLPQEVLQDLSIAAARRAREAQA